MRGTKIEATVKRVVDGDTVYVEEFQKSIRILSLDTEESYSAGGKPVTPWGKKATEYAKSLLPEGSKVILEFQGQESADEVWERYVDNFGRGLAWLHLNDGRDFQEIMIQSGYSPYFSKYGYAEWTELHHKYTQAERVAQTANIGVWNQAEVNGSQMRNYAVLASWWDLRAQLIEEYRNYKRNHPEKTIYNTRKNYLELVELAKSNVKVTIFTDMQNLRRIGGIHGLISIGSFDQPFSLFIPKMDEPQSREVINLLMNRYIPMEDERYPRRGYGYVTGRLQMFRDNPQMVVEEPAAIQDTLED
ncbi:thermonuclease family protein [Nostoc sp. CCY0012]|uniref:thermonuclease family protein n=1 Tax=Nostoc sp. CCY0012 TaxID=1056123 RepID=UPI0039C704FD